MSVETVVKTDDTVKTRIKSHLKEPPRYRVIYMNDDKITVEFVIETLIDIFNYDDDRAIEKTKEIHD